MLFSHPYYQVTDGVFIKLWLYYEDAMSVLDQLRQPEYIGENRCIPCTIVNIAIAAIISVPAAIASPILGVSIFSLSLGAIYFRGYLVPGTPTLTKRYFPERVLRWFDKDPTIPMNDETVEIDPERILLDAGAVEPCQDGMDLCLTPGFRNAWRECIHTVRENDLGKEFLTSALDITPSDDQITIDQHEDAFIAHTEDTVIGQWSSRAAAIADVAAASELAERSSDWTVLTPAETARILTSLRIFIEQCPECDGPVRVEQEVVESCCRSHDVVASACQDCDARLFEIEQDGTGTEEPQTQQNQSTQASA